jgi:hypothetical protein
MTMVLRVTIAVCAAWAAIAAIADTPETTLKHRWVYLGTNLLVDKNVDDNIKLLTRAAKAGYNGVVLTDSKFMRWDDLPEKYVQNVARLRKACLRLPDRLQQRSPEPRSEPGRGPAGQSRDVQGG